MSTTESTITGVPAGGDSTPSSGGELVPASFTTPASPSSDQGLTTPTTSAPALGEPAAPSWETVINAIPDSDDDLTQPNFQHVEGLRAQRQQLRVLKAALKEQQPNTELLQQYKALGEMPGLQAAAELVNLLYTPLTDAAGNPIVDPETQTTYVTTKPFLEYLDDNSPGMPEQLMVDLLDFQPRDESGQPTAKLGLQVMQHWGLNPAFMPQYKAIGTAQAAPPRGGISPQELADIPAEFHEAYRNLPPSVRNAWDVYDDADKAIILSNEQERLDSKQFRTQAQQESERARQFRQQQYQQLVNQEQQKYFAQVRTERFTSIATELARQYTFSTDPVTNTVLHGAVMAVAANLIDPDLRFVSDQLLTSLNIKLDHTFDEALNSFNVHAADTVAQAMAGDEVRSNQSREKANAAANLLTVKIGTVVVAVAKAMGAQQATAAAAQANAVNSAATARPTVGTGTAPSTVPAGILPPGMRPGSPEASRYLAEQTGFLRPVA